MRGKKESILWHQINPTLVIQGEKKPFSPWILFFLFKCFYILYLLFQLNALFFRFIFPFKLLQKYSHWQGKWAEKKYLISMLTELSALSFLISVLIINTDKTCGHITLFILIWSFKTRSLRWTLMTFEEGMSSHQIPKWLWRSVSGLVASRLSKHLLIWISAHLLDNDFCV